jgi:hypothetical protein
MQAMLNANGVRPLVFTEMKMVWESNFGGDEVITVRIVDYGK